MRRFASSLLVGLAALAGTVAWTSFVATATVLDPSRTDRVAEVLVTDPTVRQSVEDALTQALISVVPPSTPVPDSELRLAARHALDDPRVLAVLRTAIVEAHRVLLGEGQGPVRVDAGPIAVAGREALLTAHPELGRTLAAPPPLTVELPTDSFPNLGGLRKTAGELPRKASQAAVVLFLAALVVAADRGRILRRAGLFGLWTGGGWFAMGWLVPWAVSHWSVEGRLAVFGALAVAVARPMIAPAAALLAAGGGFLWAAFMWGKLSATRQAAKVPGPATDAPVWQPVTVNRLNTPALPPAVPLGHPASRVDIRPRD